MTEQQLLFNYRFQLGTFYTTIPSSAGLPGFGYIAWKPGFPQAISKPCFFWLQESSDINLNTLVYGFKAKWSLFEVTLGEFEPKMGPNIIDKAVDFLPTAEMSNSSVLYIPENYEYHSVGSALPGFQPVFGEEPEVPPYLAPLGITYAWTDQSVVLLEGNYELLKSYAGQV